MLRRVTIEKLAPTGEGVARTADGVGFVSGAFPGEEVEAEVGEVRKKFWKGKTSVLLSPSPLRRSGGHRDGCAGCDWAGLDLAAARQAKRELFLETMERIGGIEARHFGELPIAPSAAGYRLRSRFHVSGRAEDTRLGYFAPATHEVAPADGCEALSGPARAVLPLLCSAVASSGASAREIATVESRDADRRLAVVRLEKEADARSAGRLAASLAASLDGISVEDDRGAVLARQGEKVLWIGVGGRDFPLSPGAFFQANRFLVEDLYRDVAKAARAAAAGRALDLFAGVGLLAGALAEGGHSVVSVEADARAAGLAELAKKRGRSGSWTIVHSAALAFVESPGAAFDLVVADPPRAGLQAGLCRALVELKSPRLLYVSCEPATLARDLAFLSEGGFAIEDARLYDFFPFTHRVEAMVSLNRR